MLGGSLVSLQIQTSILILAHQLIQNPTPMNFLRKILSITLFPKPSRKELIDFALLLAVCFMIVAYKVIKS